jgi:Fe-S-cluster containining protein
VPLISITLLRNPEKMKTAFPDLPDAPEPGAHPKPEGATPLAVNPCMRCGACCACFRVAFPREEASDVPQGLVPLEFTTASGRNTLVMKGTEGRNPRCLALVGFVGACVSCLLYDRRPSTCRAFRGAWEADRVSPLCNNARARFGLPPFEPF